MLLGVFCALLRGRVVAVSYILELSREIYVFRLCAKATTVTAQQQQQQKITLHAFATLLVAPDTHILSRRICV